MDLEEKYWKNQMKTYCSLPYDDKYKYYEWQPARWAGNKVAIELIKKYLKDVKSVIELGAGSSAFSIAMKNFNNQLSISAIDKSESAKIYAKKIFDDLEISAQYYNCDLFKFKSIHKYDFVSSLGVIEHYDKETRDSFIKKCIELSNKYIFVAIPNQESTVFCNYVNWCNKNNNNYGEEHQKFNTNDLIDLMKSNGLEILVVDGFQVFLSESDFLSQDLKNNITFINKLKNTLPLHLKKEFPNYNFSAKDIDDLCKAELSLSCDDRLDMSFMTFVLAKKK